ncbi:uncharacterized protein LOC141907874 isoform X2 [Tubulanus polymorphus]|uniref:uncharacterized protein LOC141907874 isoform X2 n=1 Tax=Tubulanus polymorphus TaxID=672921 RepID=UPI003DA2FE8C
MSLSLEDNMDELEMEMDLEVASFTAAACLSELQELSNNANQRREIQKLEEIADEADRKPAIAENGPLSPSMITKGAKTQSEFVGTVALSKNATENQPESKAGAHNVGDNVFESTNQTKVIIHNNVPSSNSDNRASPRLDVKAAYGEQLTGADIGFIVHRDSLENVGFTDKVSRFEQWMKTKDSMMQRDPSPRRSVEKEMAIIKHSPLNSLMNGPDTPPEGVKPWEASERSRTAPQIEDKSSGTKRLLEVGAKSPSHSVDSKILERGSSANLETPQNVCPSNSQKSPKNTNSSSESRGSSIVSENNQDLGQQQQVCTDASSGDLYAKHSGEKLFTRNTAVTRVSMCGIVEGPRTPSPSVNNAPQARPESSSSNARNNSSITSNGDNPHSTSSSLTSLNSITSSTSSVHSTDSSRKSSKDNHQTRKNLSASPVPPPVPKHAVPISPVSDVQQCLESDYDSVPSPKVKSPTRKLPDVPSDDIQLRVISLTRQLPESPARKQMTSPTRKLPPLPTEDISEISSRPLPKLPNSKESKDKSKSAPAPPPLKPKPNLTNQNLSLGKSHEMKGQAKHSKTKNTALPELPAEAKQERKLETSTDHVSTVDELKPEPDVPSPQTTENQVTLIDRRNNGDVESADSSYSSVDELEMSRSSVIGLDPAELTSSQIDLSEKHRVIVRARKHEQELERAEKQRLEEILNMCAEYEKTMGRKETQQQPQRQQPPSEIIARNAAVHEEKSDIANSLERRTKTTIKTNGSFNKVGSPSLTNKDGTVFEFKHRRQGSTSSASEDDEFGSSDSGTIKRRPTNISSDFNNGGCDAAIADTKSTPTPESEHKHIASLSQKLKDGNKTQVEVHHQSFRQSDLQGHKIPKSPLMGQRAFGSVDRRNAKSVTTQDAVPEPKTEKTKSHRNNETKEGATASTSTDCHIIVPVASDAPPKSPSQIRTQAVVHRPPKDKLEVMNELKVNIPKSPATSPRLHRLQHGSPSRSPRLHRSPRHGNSDVSVSSEGAGDLSSLLQGKSIDQIEESDIQKAVMKLCRNRTEMMHKISHLKQLIVEIESQQEEAIRELEVERALLEGEHRLEMSELQHDQETINGLKHKQWEQIDIATIEREKEQDKIEIEKQKLHDLDKLLQTVYLQLDNCQVSEEPALTHQYTQLREQLEVQKKIFDDLEFQQLEMETRFEEDRERVAAELLKEQSDLLDRYRIREDRLQQIDEQQKEMLAQAKLDIEGLEKKRQKLLEDFRREKMRLLSTERRIRELSNLCTTCELENNNEISCSSRSSDCESKQSCDECPAKSENSAHNRSTELIEKIRSESMSPDRKMSAGMIEVEKNRLLILEQQGDTVIEEQKKRLHELKQRAATEGRAQWEERKQRETNCKSFNSLESEDSSIASSSDTPSEKEMSISSSDDPHDKILEMERLIAQAQAEKLKLLETQVHGQEANAIALQAEKHRREELEKQLKDEMARREEIIQQEVKLRQTEKGNKQSRPLTRYLPVRDPSFDLKAHIESAGHNLDLCTHVSITPTTCRGYLNKMGGKFRSWHKRWFLFDRMKRTLVYFNDKDEAKPKGGIYFQSIEDVFVDHMKTVKSPNPKLTFCVKTWDRTYFFVAPSPEAMRIWIDVIFSGAEGYTQF